MDESIAKELEIVSGALNMTQRDVIERALDYYFDHTDSAIADHIVEQIQSGKMDVFDSDAVYEEMGIDIEN